MPAPPAWLLGAIVASTDAAAVYAIIAGTLPPPLALIIGFESATNDPVAVLVVS